MKITKLILKNYNRLFLNNIKRLEFNPTKKINLVLGTNGSGKSSMLIETSPLPFDKKDFTDGYKEVHLEHNNENYIIKQDVSKFSFAVNGKELNISGNRKVQTELIKDKLNYDAEFHKLFLNLKSFTSMSTPERKAWLIKLSDIDYDYSLAYFKRLLSRDRDIRGTIKVLNNKLIEEQTHLLNNEIKNKYKEDVVVLNKLIDILLTNKEQAEEATIKNINIDSLLSVNEKLCSKIITNYPLSELDKEISSRQFMLKELSITVDKDIELLQKLKDVQNRSLDSLDNLLERKKKLNIDFNKINNRIPEYVNREAIADINYQLINSKEFLFTKLSDISIANINLSLEEFGILDREIGLLEQKEKRLIEDNTRTAAELSFSLEKKEELVTCNSCSHVFNPYYSISKEEILTKSIRDNEDELKKLSLVLKDKTETRLVYLSKQKDISEFIHEYNNKPLITPVINTIISSYNIQTDSSIISRELQYAFKEAEGWLELINIRNSIDTIDKEIKFTQDNISINTSNLSISDIETSISNNNKKIHELNLYLSLLESDKEIKISISKFNSTYNLYIKSIDKEFKNKLLKLKNDYIDSLISYLRDYKFKIEDEIRKSDMLANKVNELSKDIKQLEKTSSLLKVAIKALCPNEGLIADSIIGFMKRLVEDMNYIINSVWSYDMQIQPCELDNGELTYYFPVVTDGRGYTTDIQKTSSSMQEIIDLSFKMVAMKYSKMENYPLFLDEFGRTMDTQHRIKAFQAIDNVAVDTFSQVFIVSHFTEVYNRFHDADTIVMDSTNISIEDNRETNINIRFN